MERIIRREIEKEARKRLARFRKEIATSKYKGAKYEKRTGLPGSLKAKKKPGHWSLDKHFSPAYCLKHGRFLAKGIWKSIQSGEYAPKPAVEMKIPKPSGGFRKLHIFAIPDSAVSNLFARNLLRRNDGIFSSSSFAYRTTKTPLDAIIHLQNLTRDGKTFVVNFDFSAYFDSIPEDHIRRSTMAVGSPLLTTYAERNLIKGFLNHRYAEVDDYKKREFSRRKVGIPQGTSISLFLANAAAHELDMHLEKVSGRFVRFADDVVIVTNSYEDAISTHNLFRDFSKRSGIPINENKSQGIRIIGNVETAEIRCIDGVDFLGYRIKKDQTLVSEKGIRRIKRKIAKIIYNNLLLYPKTAPSFNPNRIGPGFVDWDLVTCINEIRRYIYGGMPESAVRGYVDASTSIRRFKGITAYYCLVDQVAQFAELDGWLLNVLLRAHRERRRILTTKCSIAPSPISRGDLLDGSWYKYPALPMETQCPSFVIAWRTARKKWARKGLVGLSIPDSFYAYE